MAEKVSRDQSLKTGIYSIVLKANKVKFFVVI